MASSDASIREVLGSSPALPPFFIFVVVVSVIPHAHSPLLHQQVSLLVCVQPRPQSEPSLFPFSVSSDQRQSIVHVERKAFVSRVLS